MIARLNETKLNETMPGWRNGASVYLAEWSSHIKMTLLFPACRMSFEAAMMFSKLSSKWLNVSSKWNLSPLLCSFFGWSAEKYFTSILIQLNSFFLHELMIAFVGSISRMKMFWSSMTRTLVYHMAVMHTLSPENTPQISFYCK